MRTVIIITLFLLASCVTQKKCLEKFPPRTDTIITVRDTTIYKDTIIYIQVEGDTVLKVVRLSDTIFLPGQVYVPDTAFAETELAFAKSWLDLSPLQIQLMLFQKDTTLRKKLDSALVKSNHWEQMYIEQTNILPEPFIPLWIKVVMTILSIVTLVLLLKNILK